MRISKRSASLRPKFATCCSSISATSKPRKFARSVFSLQISRFESRDGRRVEALRPGSSKVNGTLWLFRRKRVHESLTEREIGGSLPTLTRAASRGRGNGRDAAARVRREHGACEYARASHPGPDPHCPSQSTLLATCLLFCRDSYRCYHLDVWLFTFPDSTQQQKFVGGVASRTNS